VLIRVDGQKELRSIGGGGVFVHKTNRQRERGRGVAFRIARRISESPASGGEGGTGKMIWEGKKEVSTNADGRQHLGAGGGGTAQAIVEESSPCQRALKEKNRQGEETLKSGGGGGKI